MTEIERQEVIDNEHLKLMRMVHYIISAPTILSALYLFLLSVILLIRAPMIPVGIESETMVGLAAFYLIIGIFILIVGIGLIISGFNIKKRKRRLFSMIITFPLLLWLPTGTVISILSIILFKRPAIKKLYSDTHINKQSTLTKIG